MSVVLHESFIELPTRERVRSLLDDGTFRELLGPFDHVESPHLEPQGIVPQADDGAVIARGTIDGEPAVVGALDGGFQGGGVGEVSGAKLAAALEGALRDRASGVPTRPVLLLETGGIRLQEANLGLLAIADIHAALVALRRYTPVVGVITGLVGCFGGMGIAAGLTTHLIMTVEGRLGLNGPEVIETEAGIAELDASDRAGIYRLIGGTQRVATGFAELLAPDEPDALREAVRGVFAEPGTRPARAERYREGLDQLATIDPTSRPTPAEMQRRTNRRSIDNPVV
jgi:malonate decarboxylase beta subunit